MTHAFIEAKTVRSQKIGLLTDSELDNFARDLIAALKRAQLNDDPKREAELRKSLMDLGRYIAG